MTHLVVFSNVVSKTLISYNLKINNGTLFFFHFRGPSFFLLLASFIWLFFLLRIKLGWNFREEEGNLFQLSDVGEKKMRSCERGAKTFFSFSFFLQTKRKHRWVAKKKNCLSFIHSFGLSLVFFHVCIVVVLFRVHFCGVRRTDVF